MSIEERLTRALSEEVERVDTDVERMYSATLRRLTTPRVRRTGKLVWPLVVTLIVLVLLVGSVAILQHRGPGVPVPAGTSKEGGVSTSFTCEGRSPSTMPVASRTTRSCPASTARRASVRSGSHRPRPTRQVRRATPTSRTATTPPCGSATPTGPWPVSAGSTEAQLAGTSSPPPSALRATAASWSPWTTRCGWAPARRSRTRPGA